MAAGQVDVLRRDFYKHSKRQNGHYRNDSHGAEYGRGRDHGARRKNGYHYSSKTRDWGSRRDGFGSRIEERKVEDLSKGDKVAGYEDGVRLPAEKKRKISPIVWDREEKDVRVSSKNRVVLVAPLPSPCPPAPSSSGVACHDVLDVDVSKCAVSGVEIQGFDNLADKAAVEDGLVGELNSQTDLSSSLPSEKSGDDCRQENVEEEEFVGARNISMSRWASDDETLDDSRRSSPESGEICTELSGEVRARSSSFDGDGCSVGPVSGNTYCESELLDADSMGIDDKQDENTSVTGSDADSEDDGDTHHIEETRVPTQRSTNMLQGCRSVYEFEYLKKINEGTYGVVYKAKDRKTGEIVALKKVKMGVEKGDGFPLSSLREINILMSFNHPSVVGVKEVVMDEDDFDSVFMVMEYMESDLKGVLEAMKVKKQLYCMSEVKCLMRQLLEGVKYLHDNWVIHRDLKTSNLLLSNEGELKICDFGLSRQYGSPLKPYTPLVVTLWYRAPELLLGTMKYSTAIDMWSVGCIMAELVAQEALFRGKNEIDQLGKIFQILGTPNDKIWPGLTKLRGVRPNIKQPYNLLRKKFPARSFIGSPVLCDSGFDLLNKLLTYDPEKRITAEAALKHDWFSNLAA
ncbi:hypothetical protein RGQ29_004382 [Quercus rubra]|uniref:cyclin-dependent kinase n=1 Tax=Quercus rubra TaxID=3512 RepID=A0AAN7IFD5_QUERU|nr:hypothetical protein RGQ29_004382 [Quercus rubra]